jgi:hypothetical protein
VQLGRQFKVESKSSLTALLNKNYEMVEYQKAPKLELYSNFSGKLLPTSMFYFSDILLY